MIDGGVLLELAFNLAFCLFLNLSVYDFMKQ